MGLFKLRKNKRYGYSGRFSEENTYVGKQPVPKKIKSKFDEFRTTVGDDNSFRKKFKLNLIYVNNYYFFNISFFVVIIFFDLKIIN